MSQKNNLNYYDMVSWFRTSIIFLAPAILALLLSLQASFAVGHFPPSPDELTFALGAFYAAFIGSAIKLLQKYSQST